MRKTVSVVILVAAILMGSVVPAGAQASMCVVSGRVFLDGNHNGVWDAGEGPVDADGPVVVIAGRYRAEVSADGTYQLSVPRGTYRVRVSVVGRGRLVATTAPFVVVSVPPDRRGVNFGFASEGSGKLVVRMLPKVARPKVEVPRESGPARP